MHPVRQLILNRLAGKPDTAKLAIVASGGAQRWPIVGGMLARAKSHGLNADIMGGTSGGGLTILYIAAGNEPNDVMVLRHLTHKGFDRKGGRRFINLGNLFRGKPVLDVEGLIEDAFSKHFPVNWTHFAKLEKPTFLIATSPDGQKVVQRLDGQNVQYCKEAAKHTGRIPFISHTIKDKNVLWDGFLVDDFPISTAFELGATHVLALSCRGQNENTHKPHFLSRYALGPFMKRHQPHLAHLIPTHYQNLQNTMAQYKNDKRVLMAQLPHVQLKGGTTKEKLLLQGALDGWDYFGEVMGLSPLPYPPKWQEAMRENGLL
jgi:predicted patatin/cPLA2 family phospholipase